MSRISPKKRSAIQASKGHLKKAGNWLAQKLGRKPFFELTTMDRMASSGVLGFPNKHINAAHRWYRWGFHDTLVGWSLLILVVLYIIVQTFGVDVGAENLWTEYWGLIFDVMVILVGFGLIQNWKQKRETIARQHELIEDFRRWDNEEATHRILGAIRRLNRQGITKFDFTGGVLKNVSFSKNGISSIVGAELSGGSWIDERYKTSVFKNVDFSRLDCRDVRFERAALFNGHILGPSAQYINCDFWDADLQNSVFDGASLIWGEPAPDDMGEIVGENPDGSPAWTRTVAGRFNDADLANASFRQCEFMHADFREAYNILHADFFGAKGLETCLFDSDDIKNKVIAQSQEARP